MIIAREIWKKKNEVGSSMRKLKMDILLWIQGWSGQLNSWAWTEWDKLHRKDWVDGYNKRKGEDK
jgi:hypothetical protein